MTMLMVAEKTLIDTNILVYAHDNHEIEKQRIAIELLDSAAKMGLGLVSTQILGEFFRIVTRKISEPLPPAKARMQVEILMKTWPVLQITSMIISEAIRGVIEHSFSYWDAQIWATAKLNQIGDVLSEDFSNNSIVEGVRFINPFLKS